MAVAPSGEYQSSFIVYLSGQEIVQRLQASDQILKLKGEAGNFGKRGQSLKSTLTDEMKKAYEELQKLKDKK